MKKGQWRFLVMLCVVFFALSTKMVCTASAAMTVEVTYDTQTVQVKIKDMAYSYNYYGLKIIDDDEEEVERQELNKTIPYGSEYSASWRPSKTLDYDNIEKYRLQMYVKDSGTVVFSTGIIFLGVPTEGNFGTNNKLHWAINESGVLTITGGGTMGFTTTVSAPWTGIRNKIKSVIIAEGVTRIGYGAFYNCDNLTSITFPSTLSIIEEWAFASCDQLERLELPGSLEQIKDSAFYECRNLSQISFPDTLTNIESNAFCYLENITSLVIPDSVVSIGDNCFFGCEKLESVKLPSGLTEINDQVFCNCPSLISIVLTDNIFKIGRCAFFNCTSLKTVYIPYSVGIIEDFAFYVTYNGTLSTANTAIEDVYYSGSTAQWDAIDGLKKEINGSSVPAFSSTTLIHHGIFEGKILDFHFDDAPPRDMIDGVERYDTAICYTDDNHAVIGGTLRYDIDVPEADLIDQLKKISFDVSDTDVAEIEGSFYNTGLFDSKTCYWGIALSLKKPGLITIGATSPDGGYYDDWRLTVEPQLILDTSPTGYTVSTPKDVYFFSTSFCDAGTDFLERFMSQVSVTVNDVDAKMNLSSKRILYSTNNISAALVYRVDPEASGEVEYEVRTEGGQYLHNVITLDYVSDLVKSVDEYITAPLYENFDEITKNIPESDWFRVLNEYFSNNGLTDASVGVNYLRETHNKRNAYRYLITDELYCVHNYAQWLNNNLSARAALVASGLVFNNELQAWLSFGTYVESDYPGVKKYKTMLYDFMDASSVEIAALSAINDVTEFAKNATDVQKLVALQIIDNLKNCKSLEDINCELSGRGKDFLASISLENNADGSRSVIYTLDESTGFGKYAKAVDVATNIVPVVTVGIDEALNLFQLNQKLAVYAQYIDFLNEIIQAIDVVPFEMRFAAYQIKNEIETQHLGAAKTAVIHLLREIGPDSFLYDTLMDSLGGATLGLDIGVFFANQIFGIGDFVNEAAYVEGYNFISNLFSQRLQESARAFSENKTDDTAMDFYYYYTMLYQLRYKGEQAYLEMSDIDGLVKIFNDYGYAEKEALVNEQLKYLEDNCIFNTKAVAPLNNTTRYHQKTIVRCPVNIIVRNNSGDEIVTLMDGVPSDVTNSYGRFTVVYSAVSEDYLKVVCLNDEENYRIEMVGVSDGVVSCEYATASDQDDIVHYFTNETIRESGQILMSTNQIATDGIYDVDSNGDGTFETKLFDLLSSNPTTDIPDTVLAGDFDGNGKFTIGDANSMIYLIVNSIQPTESQLKVADFNNDGKITIGDVNSVIHLVVNS